MDLQEKLNSIVTRNEMSVSMGPYQEKLLKQQELYKDLLRAKEDEKYAPNEVSKAEKEYYTYRDGEDGYKRFERKKYDKEGQEQQAKLLDKFTNHNDELSGTLATTETQQYYLKNVNVIQTTLLDKVNKELKKKQKDIIESDTNYRKSYYLEQEQQNIDAWITFCNYVLIVLLCIYIYHNYETNSKMMFFGIAVIFTTLTLLKPMIHLFQSIPKDFNVYTNWGYSPDAPRKSVIIYIIFSLVFIYIILYAYDHQAEIIKWFNTVIIPFFNINVLRYTTTPDAYDPNRE